MQMVNESQASKYESHDFVTPEDTIEVPPEVIALIRLLGCEPASNHDLSTCAICRKFGIDGI